MESASQSFQWRTPSKEKVEVGWPEQDKRKSKWWSDHAAGTWHFCFQAVWGGSVRGHGGHVPANQGLEERQKAAERTERRQMGIEDADQL